MPLPARNWDEYIGNPFLQEQRQYNIAEEARLSEINKAKLNREQRIAHDAIVDAALGKSGDKVFFLNGAAGTGKTFTWNTIMNTLRGQEKIVLCVASSGIASIMLKGGKTAHSTFKIPLDIHETSTCDISKQSPRADMIRQVSLIIWDEAAMQHKHVVEAVDRTLRDITGHTDIRFGGIPVAFGGDFRQILPVVPHGGMEDIVNACLKSSHLWNPKPKMLHLTKNMRVDPRDPSSIQFANWLLSVGAGQAPSPVNKITLPEHMISPHNVVDLINATYPGIGTQENLADDYFLERAILAPKNVDINEINSLIIRKYKPNTEVKTFYSVDTVVDEHDSTNEEIAGAYYPAEFLSSINIGGLPPSKLEVKAGVPLMLLRNLDQAQGLCNGTRLRLLDYTHRVLRVKILTGPSKGQIAFIPRITLEAKKTDLEFALHRKQFPVRLAFAMTINKAQGQSLGHVGVYLLDPVFSHGQLYVALSRATSGNRLWVLVKESDEGKTDNIVYTQVFSDP